GSGRVTTRRVRIVVFVGAAGESRASSVCAVARTDSGGFWHFGDGGRTVGDARVARKRVAAASGGLSPHAGATTRHDIRCGRNACYLAVARCYGLITVDALGERLPDGNFERGLLHRGQTSPERPLSGPDRLRGGAARLREPTRRGVR